MAKVGSLEVDLNLQSANFSNGMKRAADQTEQVRKSMDRAIGTFRNTRDALATAFAVDELMQATQRAFDFNDAIVDLSDRTGVATKAIQEFRYAAQMSGSGVEDADAAIAKFAKNIGDAQNGSDSMAKKLRDLGVTSTDTGTALRQAADGISKLATPAQRTAATMEIMGKSAGTLSVTMSKGAKGMDEMAAEADRLGIVMGDDLLRNSGQVNDKLDTMKMILNAQFASAVATNADAIGSMASSVISLSSALAQFWGQNPQKAMAIMGALAGGAVGGRLGGLPGAAAGALAGGIGGAMLGRSIRETTYARNDKWRAARDLETRATNAQAAGMRDGASRAALEKMGQVGLKARRERQRLEAGIDNGSITIGDLPSLGDMSGGGGGGGTLRTPKGSTPKKSAGSKPNLKTDAELEYAWLNDMMRVRGSIGDASAELENTPSARRQARVDSLRDDLILRQKDIKNDTGTDQEVREGKKRYTALQAEQLNLMEKELYDLRYDLEIREEQEALAQEKLSISLAANDNERDLLSSEQNLARSSQARQAIGLRIVALEYEREKLQLESVVASKTATDAEKKIAEERLKILGRLRGNAEAQVREQTAGPLESFLKSIPQTAGEINDQMEAVQVDGLKNLEDGLMDVVKGTGSVKDAFKNMADSIISGLIRIAIQQAIIKPLGAALFGGGESGGGGILGSIIGSVVKGAAGARANGGLTRPGLYEVGERGRELVSIGANANVIPNHALGNMRGGNGGPVVNINGPITSNDPDMVRQMIYQGIAQAMPMINEQASNRTMQKLQRRQM